MWSPTHTVAPRYLSCKNYIASIVKMVVPEISFSICKLIPLWKSSKFFFDVFPFSYLLSQLFIYSASEWFYLIFLLFDLNSLWCEPCSHFFNLKYFWYFTAQKYNQKFLMSKASVLTQLFNLFKSSIMSFTCLLVSQNSMWYCDNYAWTKTKAFLSAVLIAYLMGNLFF